MNPTHLFDSKRTALLRKSNRLTQAELAAKLGIARETLARWETGKATPRAGLLPSLATALGVTVDALLTNNDDVLGQLHLPEPREVA